VFANVIRLTDEAGMVDGYHMDVSVKCMQCDRPFAFVGLPKGWSASQPTMNFEQTEMSVPLVPSVVDQDLS
jgi:hypothetical protein